MFCGMWVCFTEGAEARGVVGFVDLYEIRMGLLLVLCWSRVRHVSLGRESSEGEILGANCCMSLLWLRCKRCVCCCMPFSTILIVNPGSPGLESSVLVSS